MNSVKAVLSKENTHFPTPNDNSIFASGSKRSRPL